MSYVYDFKKFIDSPDIRGYNIDSTFTPAEQSVLIYMSQKQTIDEKLCALRWLLDGDYDKKKIEHYKRSFAAPICFW